MSSSVFDDSSSYAPGVSVGMPVDADAFLANYANKKGRVRKKDIKAYREGGGDMQGLRDALEGNVEATADDPFGQRQYKVNENAMQNVRNAAPSMDNVARRGDGQISTRSFIDEYANARGRVSKADMKAFKKAGGNLAGLDKRLQKGGFTRDEVKAVEENLNKRGTAIKAGNEDYYTGNAGKRFLDKRLRSMGVDDPVVDDPVVPIPDTDFPDEKPDDQTPAEGIVDEIVNDDGTPPPNEVGEGGTPDAGLDLGLKVDYGDIDPSSGFPYNPGRHDGKPFTNYKENISGIMDRTDERLDAIRELSPRMTPEDTLTYSLTEQLMAGGVLPGSEGYVTPQEKDAARLEGDLAIRNANSPEVMDARREQYKKDLKSINKVNASFRADKSEALWGEGGMYDQMRQAQSDNMLRPEDYLPAMTSMYMPAPSDVIGKPPKEKKDKVYGGMGNLPDKPKKQPLETPDLYTKKTTTTEGRTPPDDYKKNPSFDGSDFDEFLQRAKMGGDATKLYNALKDAGFSEKEMLKGAQHAGISNLRTSNKSMKDDIKAIQHAIDNDYYKGWDGKGETTTKKVLKDQKELMSWYKKQGGEVPLKILERKAGYEKYNSVNDAEKLVNTMQNQLSKAGIKGEVDPKEMVKFNNEMDKLNEKFGGKYKWKNYQQALKDNSAADVNSWLTNYMNLGGDVNKRVQDAMQG